MSEIPAQNYLRKARPEDFINDDEDNDDKNDREYSNDRNTHQDKSTIYKNQREYGHRKRIKP